MIEFELTKKSKTGATTPEEVAAPLGEKALRTVRLMQQPQDTKYVFFSLDSLGEYLCTGNTSLYHLYTRQHPRTEPAVQQAKPTNRSSMRYASSQKNIPEFFEVEQTPYRTGDNRPPAKVAAKSPLDLLQKNVDQRRREPAMNVKRGATTNVFQYELQLTFRTTPLQSDGQFWHELTKLEALNQRVTARSPMYQSAGKKLPTGDTDIQRTVRSSLTEDIIGEAVRYGVGQAISTGLAYDQFIPTIAYAHQRRGGKNDLTTVSQKNPEKKGGYELPDSSISSSCFHSETQALGMTTRELPPILDELVDNLLAVVLGLDPPIGVVFNSLHVLGASNPNTVCGNACKPALTNLLEIIARDFAAAVNRRKAGLEGKDIYLRNSQGFRAHMSVGAPEEFEGYQTGAIKVESSAKPSHLVVTEFPPAIRIVDNPKRQARKEKRAAAKVKAAGPMTTAPGKRKAPSLTSDRPAKKPRPDPPVRRPSTRN